MVAVQWHPELLDDLDPAFVWLVEQARLVTSCEADSGTRTRRVSLEGPLGPESEVRITGPQHGRGTWISGDAHADITSHDTYVDGVPHATFARLRREDPVSWWDEADGSGLLGRDPLRRRARGQQGPRAASPSPRASASRR